MEMRRLSILALLLVACLVCTSLTRAYAYVARLDSDKDSEPEVAAQSNGAAGGSEGSTGTGSLTGEEMPTQVGGVRSGGTSACSGQVRFMTPYALRNLFASRLQNSDYLGKRMGSEFLGRKRSSPMAEGPVAHRATSSLQDSNSNPIGYFAIPPQFMSQLQKKMGSEFLGRRKRQV